MGTQHLRRMGRAHPTEARAHNRAVVLQHLFQSGPESRAELARTTGLTRVTMSALVEDLMNEGLVIELGREDRPGKVGKRATLVGLSEETWQIAAINLTNDGVLSGAILTLGGRIVHRLQEQSALPQGNAGIDALTSFCHKVTDTADCQILGVGVSSPGIITPDGTVEQAPNRGWYGVPLAQILEERLSLPVHVANDANCAALAEYTFGGAQGDGLLRIVIGHGVGAGIVAAGALMQGSENAAGEIGHVTIVDDRDGPDSPRTGTTLRLRAARLPRNSALRTRTSEGHYGERYSRTDPDRHWHSSRNTSRPYRRHPQYQRGHRLWARRTVGRSTTFRR